MAKGDLNPKKGGIIRFKQKSLPKYNRLIQPDEEGSIGQIQITDGKDEYSTVGAREAYNNDLSAGPIFIND